jgi:hypothetical protein
MRFAAQFVSICLNSERRQRHEANFRYVPTHVNWINWPNHAHVAEWPHAGQMWEVDRITAITPKGLRTPAGTRRWQVPRKGSPECVAEWDRWRPVSGKIFLSSMTGRKDMGVESPLGTQDTRVRAQRIGLL